VLATAACENTSTAPVAVGPSTLSSFLAPRLTGVWGGEVTMTAVAGGTGSARNAGGPSCVNSTFDEVVGETVDHRLSITQDGSNLTAQLVSVGTGLACTYQGQVTSGGSMVLHTTTCTPLILSVRCPPNPDSGVEEVALLELAGSNMTATFDDPTNVTQLRGSAAFTYNVRDRVGNPISSLVTNHTFTNLTRR
jgi:hypothetical protein